MNPYSLFEQTQRQRVSDGLTSFLKQSSAEHEQLCADAKRDRAHLLTITWQSLAARCEVTKTESEPFQTESIARSHSEATEQSPLTDCFKSILLTMRLATSREKIAIATAYQVWELRNVPAVAQ